MKGDSEKGEYQPVLDQHDLPCLDCQQGVHKRLAATARRWQWIAGLVIAANILMLAVAAIMLRVPGRLQCMRADSIGALFHSPFEDSQQYKAEDGERAHWQKEVYWNPPTDESEKAWDDLTQHPRPIFLQSPDTGRLGFQELPGSAGASGGNFTVLLSVWHNLHCLRNIRMAYYEDHYFSDQTQEERAARRQHELHCLEAVRSSVVCNADLTAYPMLWKDGVPNTELQLNSGINRKCVDLQALKAEMKRYMYED